MLHNLKWTSRGFSFQTSGYGVEVEILGKRIREWREEGGEMKVVLYVGREDEKGREAFDRIRRRPDLDVEKVVCPDSVGEWYALPFLRDEVGRSYAGLDGIDFFLREHTTTARSR